MISLPCYPLQPFNFNNGKRQDGEESFSKKLSRRMEFIELSQTIKSEERPQYIKDEFNDNFYHQEVVKRFMINYDRLLVIHPPGKGKTCTAVGIAEHLKEYGSNIQNREGFPKKTYILERGPSVIADIRNQIAYTCAKNIYNVKESASSKGQKKILTTTLAKFYTIQTYKDFSSTNLTDEMIAETYSDCVFIIDEAHNIVGQTKAEDEDGEDISDENMNKNDIEASYNYIKRVFSLAKRTKIIIMSATPMTNSSNEIGKILNLLLPPHKQISKIGAGGVDFSTISENDFKGYVDGMVSYVPDEQSKIKIHQIGEILPVTLSNGNMSETIVTHVPMQGLQATVYREVDRKFNLNPGPFFLEHRKVSGFVFPDGSYGGTVGKSNSGLYKYVDRPDGDTFIPKESFKHEIRKNIHNLSSKFAYVIDKELNGDRTIQLPSKSKIKSVTLPGRGCSFFYFDFVTAHAIPFAMCLEAFGYERYNDGMSSFITANGKKTLNMEKKKRYIFVTKDNVASKLDNFKEIFNSKENVYGEYVQIIIGSRIIKDGINLFNVARIYINPSWNPANMIQAIYRAIRAVGHDNLIKSIKELMKKNNVEQTFIDNFIYVVEQHKLSAFLETRSKLSVSSSVDDYMYINTIEEKSLDINRIMNMLIKYSFDRYINGNESSGILTKENVNYNTFDTMYSGRLIQYITNIIISLFKDNKYIYSFEELSYIIFEKLPPLLRMEKYINISLKSIISNGLTIRDKYNNKMWIQIQGEFVFITNTYPDGLIGNVNNSFYHQIIINEKVLIRDRIVKYCEENIKKLMLIPYEDRNILSNIVITEYLILRELNVNEEATNKDWWVSSNERLDPLLRRLLKSVLHVIWKPIVDMKETAYLLSLPSTSKGVKAADNSKIKLKKMVYMPEPKTNIEPKSKIKVPLVIYHSLERENIRIIEVSETNKDFSWKNARTFEESVYNHHINVINNNKTNNLPVGKLYAMSSLDGKFIIDRVKKNEKKIEDKRLKSKGKECSNILKQDLALIFMEEGIKYKDEDLHLIDDRIEDINEMKNYLIKLKVKGWSSNDDIRLLYKWIASNITKAYMCGELKLHLEKENRLLQY